MSYVNTVDCVDNKITDKESGVMKRLNKLHKILTKFLPKDRNGDIEEISRIPNEVEENITRKSQLMKKSIRAFKSCCSYLDLSEKVATQTNIPSKYVNK